MVIMGIGKLFGEPGAYSFCWHAMQVGPRIIIDHGPCLYVRERECTSGVLDACGNLCCYGCNEVGVMTVNYSMEVWFLVEFGFSVVGGDVAL
jgi:hypothetical protein